MSGVSILLIALTASHPNQEAPILRASTPKSLDDFGQCFVRVQEQHSRAWAFVPTETGGTFSNAGADGVATPYWLRVSEAQPVNQIRLFAAKGSDESGSLVEAVNQCR
jgi:hypothetical protein